MLGAGTLTARPSSSLSGVTGRRSWKLQTSPRAPRRAQGAKGFTVVLGIRDITLLSVCAAACGTADIAVGLKPALIRDSVWINSLGITNRCGFSFPPMMAQSQAQLCGLGSVLRRTSHQLCEPNKENFERCSMTKGMIYWRFLASPDRSSACTRCSAEWYQHRLWLLTSSHVKLH